MIWRDTMKSRIEEALATLVHEGAEIESWFRIKIEGQDYLLWYMRAESMKKVFEVSRTFKHPIDTYASLAGAGRVQGEQHCCERPDRSPRWTAARQDAGASRTNGPADEGESLVVAV